MRIIKKKTWPEFFEKVKSGEKRFELRLADFEIEKGDELILKEWDPKEKNYTGRRIEKKIDYVYHFNIDDFGQGKEVIKKGLNVIQFE